MGFSTHRDLVATKMRVVLPDGDTRMIAIPSGFEPLTIESPFLKLVGPFYYKREGETLIVGVRVEKKHCNSMGLVHGGLLSTLGDLALGFDIASSGQRLRPTVTVSLSTDFLRSATLNDWLEARVDIQKVGKLLAFGNTYIYANGERIARSSAVFTTS
jgi:acyl-coenzyme A thioesterase 13